VNGKTFFPTHLTSAFTFTWAAHRLEIEDKALVVGQRAEEEKEEAGGRASNQARACAHLSASEGDGRREEGREPARGEATQSVGVGGQPTNQPSEESIKCSRAKSSGKIAPLF